MTLKSRAFLYLVVSLSGLLLTAPLTFALGVDAPDSLVRFDDTHGAFLSLQDTVAHHEHIAPGIPGALWMLELPAHAGGAVHPEEAGEFQSRTDEKGQLFMKWSSFERACFSGLSVETVVSYDDDLSAFRFKIALQGLGPDAPVTVHFPRIPAVAAQEAEVLAVPYWMGEKTTRARQLLSPSPGVPHRRDFAYPGLLSLQCLAFYREGGPGLYLAADDIQARSKSFAAFGDGQGGLGLEVCHFPAAGEPKTDWQPGYDVLLGVFQGDWITVAERYRRWALEQPWAKESRLKRGRTPAWAADTGFWIWNRGYSDGVLTPAVALQEYLGMPVSVFWHWWHGCSYDTGFPEYLPPREGVEPFREAVHDAKKKGVNAIVYMNQRLWGMNTESWKAEQAERFAVKKTDGTIQPEVYNTFTKAPNASMCMGTPFWRNKYAGLAEEVFRGLGVGGVYMDQACSSLVCYDTEHGHAPGGGTYWMEGFRSLEHDIRNRCSGIVLAGEGCGEAWLPHLDLMLSLQVSRERYAAPNEWTPIPFFHAVYHGYTVLYGNYASLTRPPYDPLWPPEFAPEHPLQLLDEKFQHQFRLEQARSFVWGQQPCLANFLPEHLDVRAPDLAYIRQIARLRNQALPYLLHGTFMRPPRMNIPETEIDVSRLSIYAGQRDAVKEYRMSVPEYLLGMWRAEDGSLAVAIAGISDEEQALSFTLTSQEHGLPEHGCVFKLLPEERFEILRFTDGAASINDTLVGAGSCIYLFTEE